MTEPSLAIESGDFEHLTAFGHRVGTPPFMSSEQAGARSAEVGPASDIYSLGATLYSVLTGRAPFSATTLADLLREVERGEFPPPLKVLRWIDRPIEMVALKAMALKPADRYGAAPELAEDIRRWLADEPVIAWPEPLPLPAVRWARTLVASSAMAAVVGLSAFGYAFYQSRAYLLERRVAALERVAALGTAEVGALPRIVEDLGSDLALARADLEALARGDGSGWASDDRRRFRGVLALLAVEPGGAGFLERFVRAPQSGPDEVLVVRQAMAKLAPTARLGGLFRRDLEVIAPGGMTDAQLRSAGALAQLDPRSSLWDGLSAPLARKIVLENPLRIDGRRGVFQPVSRHLAGPLLAISADPGQAVRRDLALTLLFEFADQPTNPTRPEDLAMLLTEAPPGFARQIVTGLVKPSERSRAVARLAPMLEPVARFDEARAALQGRGALALLRLGSARRGGAGRAAVRPPERPERPDPADPGGVSVRRRPALGTRPAPRGGRRHKIRSAAHSSIKLGTGILVLGARLFRTIR